MEAEQPELRQELAELRAEKQKSNQKKLKASWFGRGFLFGAAAGLSVFVGMMNFVITPKTKTAMGTYKDANLHLQADLAACNVQLDGTKRLMATQHVVDLSSAVADSIHYTVLAERSVSPSNTSALELLNLVRPGLGTIAEKLAQANRPVATAPRWIVPGFLRPLSIEKDGSYSWVNLQTGEVQTYTVGATQTTQ